MLGFVKIFWGGLDIPLELASVCVFGVYGVCACVCTRYPGLPYIIAAGRFCTRVAQETGPAASIFNDIIGHSKVTRYMLARWPTRRASLSPLALLIDDGHKSERLRQEGNFVMEISNPYSSWSII